MSAAAHPALATPADTPHPQPLHQNPNPSLPPTSPSDPVPSPSDPVPSPSSSSPSPLPSPSTPLLLTDAPEPPLDDDDDDDDALVLAHDPPPHLVLPQDTLGPSSRADAPHHDPQHQSQQAHDNNNSADSHDSADAQLAQDSAAAEDAQQWFHDEGRDLKRVKVYELINSRWIDQGTAFCFGHYDDSTQEALLIARAESSYSEVILQTSIRSSDVYQRQQDTLIVWTEPDGVDYALSFQDPEGCAEVWQFILEVQRIHQTGSGPASLFGGPSSSSPGGPSGGPGSGGAGPDPSMAPANIIKNGLPPPALGIIGDIEKAIKVLSRAATGKDKVCEYIHRSKYLKGMIDILAQAEDLECLDDLHALCTLMQTILMMNDHTLYEHILDDEYFIGVVGMLEYDPEFPTHKANYRDFLRTSANFHEPIALHDASVQKKVHHTYRLQFLKDVVLARILDDSTFNVLNSCIIFNQIDIINHVQNDVRFLGEIVDLFVNADGSTRAEDDDNELGTLSAVKEKDPMDVDAPVPADPVASAHARTPSPGPHPAPPPPLAQRRRAVLLLLQQLCIMGKNVQLPTRMALFKLLVDRGVVHATQWALARPEGEPEGRRMIAVGGEVLTTLLDHDVNGVREHVLRQFEGVEGAGAGPSSGGGAGAGASASVGGGEKKKEREQTLLSLLCSMLVSSRELAVQTLVGDALRMMLEMPLPDGADPMQIPTKMFSRPKDDPKTERFLDCFYKLCIHPLLKPVFDVPDRKLFTEPTLRLTREKTNLFLSLCDLLSIFALQHTFRSHFFMLTSNISTHVATLLCSRDKHLRLAALRYFRIHLRRNNKNFMAHLLKQDVFKAILELALQESDRDTLVNSSCQEFFDHMRKENMKEAIDDIMTRQEALVRQLAQSRFAKTCFEHFILRWEMNTAPEPPKEEKPPAPHLSQPFELRRQEAEEESYFNTDDDDDDDDGSPPLLSTPLLTRHQFAGQKRKRQRVPGVPMRALRPPSIHLPRAPLIGSLVDYDEDEDERDLALDLNLDLDRRLAPLGPQDGDAEARADPVAPVPTPDAPPTPRLSHRLIASTKRERTPDVDDADGGGGDEQPDTGGGGGGGGGFIPLSPRPEKRRRGDDDGDDMGLERLLSKVKRPSLTPVVPAKEGAAPTSAAPPPAGAGRVGVTGGVKPGAEDGGPKKIKLKFGMAGLAVASSAPSAAAAAAAAARSEPGVKDGDTG